MDAFIIIYLAICVLLIVSQWKIYTKANHPGWACLISIYNIIVLLKIIGKPWWWELLLLLVLNINIVYAIWINNLLSLSFWQK